MGWTEATAPGKIILFGEHAVVYGRPAIAAPLTKVRATAIVKDSSQTGIWLEAPDLKQACWLADADENDPLALAVQITIASAGLFRMPDLSVSVSSTIPIASGLGSGAAMAAAVIRALAKHLGVDDLATNEQVSSLTYQVEKLLHGTPSGIDNTVVSYEMPVFFVRQEPENLIETLKVAKAFHFIVANTGAASKTKEVVGDVRRQWMADPERFEKLFDNCGQVCLAARRALEQGDSEQLGQLMNQNQNYLRQMTVSSPELEHLIMTAVKAGALGAKLSGAGRGGNMIALVDGETEDEVLMALLASGAASIMTTVLHSDN